MEKYQVTSGVYWISIPEADLRILCGCPADVIKHCKKGGFILSTEKEGVQYETGPNGILLSDVSIQNGRIANLAEFPILQMFYRQGMIIPEHPNNTGQKPLLIGLQDQVNSQMEYIYRGNYGLVSVDEIVEAGIPRETAEAMMRMKLHFAFDRIKQSDELIEAKVIDREIIELKPGVHIRRMGLNQYQFIHGDEVVTVDLNLKKYETYYPPYNLGYHRIKRDYFSVIHIGEGDGWDVTRPCMGSIIIFQGKIYLIDAGPNIMNSLNSLGICITEVEGIFHTHAHDDHFAGLPSLIRTGHKLKYYATPLVRHSVEKKIAALLSMDEQRFGDYFEIHDLEFDMWNDIAGLEVKPVFSPHPVETSIMFFRTYWEGGYQQYAHLADIASFDNLEKMVTSDKKKSGISQEWLLEIKQHYLEPATIKKIDIGGGLIHGKAEDFINDTSRRLLLSHTADPLSNSQKEIGSNATFGMRDIMIRGQQDYSMNDSFNHLKNYFTTVDEQGLDLLANCPVMTVNVGTILIKQGEPVSHLFLIVNGVVDVIDTSRHIESTISPGSLIGEIEGITGDNAQVTYRAASYIRVLKISCDLYRWFIDKYHLSEEIKRISDNRNFLRLTWLFGESIPTPVQSRVAQAVEHLYWSKDEEITNTDGDVKLYMIMEGSGILLSQKQDQVDVIEFGDFFGEDAVITTSSGMFTFRVTEDVHAISIPVERVQDIPIVQWKLVEQFEKRLKIVRTHFQVRWYDSYALGLDELDRQHKSLFDMLEELYTIKERYGFGDEFEEKLASYIETLESHLMYEESLMTKWEYHRYPIQKNAHTSIMKTIEQYMHSDKHDTQSHARFLDQIKEWLLSHTLIEDRKYAKFFRDRDVR